MVTGPPSTHWVRYDAPCCSSLICWGRRAVEIASEQLRSNFFELLLVWRQFSCHASEEGRLSDS